MENNQPKPLKHTDINARRLMALLVILGIFALVVSILLVWSLSQNMNTVAGVVTETSSSSSSSIDSTTSSTGSSVSSSSSQPTTVAFSKTIDYPKFGGNPNITLTETFTGIAPADATVGSVDPLKISGSDFSLELRVPFEGSPVIYTTVPTVTKIVNSNATAEIYRTNTSQDGKYAYNNKLNLTASECDVYETGAKACGFSGINVPAYVKATCTTSTDTGLAKCDAIVKSLKVTSVQK